MPAESVIHDIGYRRYSGVRRGRWYVVCSLYLHGVRAAFGLGRGAKAKIFPWLVVTVMLSVAVVVAAVRSQVGHAVLSYTDVPDAMSVNVVMFLAVVAPELVCRDLRAGVLPLYFSRPMRRPDYVLARLAALMSALALVLAAPQVVMFAGAAFGVNDLSAVADELADLVPGLLYAGVYALLFSAIALLVASLTGNRAFAAGGIVAVFLVTVPIVGVLSVVGGRTMQHLAGLASPVTMANGVGEWLFDPGVAQDARAYGPGYGVAATALVAVCVLLLLARYQKVSR